MLLRNDGPSMDERDAYWSMMVNGDGSQRVRIEDDAQVEISGLEATIMMYREMDEFFKIILHNFVHINYMVLRHLILWARPMYFRTYIFREFLESVYSEESPFRVRFGTTLWLDENPFLSSLYTHS